MSKIKTGNPSNIKPDSWYKEYFKIKNSYLLKYPEEQIPLTTIKEIKGYDVMADKNQSHDHCSGFLQFEEKNNLETNKELLAQYKKELESLKLWKSIKDIDKIDDNSWEYYLLQTSFKIDKCFESLEQGYLITAQLEDIMVEIDNYWHNEDDAKPILDIFKQFNFGNYQEELYDFIKQNTNWRNKERDFEIYKEIQKGTLYSEIAGRLECDISTISKINKKVQSSINNLKGKLFEIEYEKYLNSLAKLNGYRIVRDGEPGKPDIYITNEKKKEMYVLSLKNLELNKKSFCITKKQLKPELEFAYYNSTFEVYKNVVLYLIVFDSLTEKLYVNELNFRNPSNVNIYH